MKGQKLATTYLLEIPNLLCPLINTNFGIWKLLFLKQEAENSSKKISQYSLFLKIVQKFSGCLSWSLNKDKLKQSLIWQPTTCLFVFRWHNMRHFLETLEPVDLLFAMISSYCNIDMVYIMMKYWNNYRMNFSVL